MAELTLHEKLIDIQQRLKVPKDKRNEYSTSKFMYRNLEAIEEAVKPILKEYKLALVFSDEVLAVGDRVFVKATATINDGTDSIAVSAYAQHATEKKGMDEAQLTGSCSSYARKYAAGGLFLIDETKDADSMDNSALKATRKANTDTTKTGAEQEIEAIAKADEKKLAQAKSDINEELINQNYITVDAKKAFIKGVLQKETIDTIEDAHDVAFALENEA